MQSYFLGYVIRCSSEVAYTAHNLMLNTGSIDKSISNCNRTPESLSHVSNHINQGFFKVCSTLTNVLSDISPSLINIFLKNSPSSPSSPASFAAL